MTVAWVAVGDGNPLSSSSNHSVCCCRSVCVYVFPFLSVRSCSSYCRCCCCRCSPSQAAPQQTDNFVSTVPFVGIVCVDAKVPDRQGCKANEQTNEQVGKKEGKNSLLDVTSHSHTHTLTHSHTHTLSLFETKRPQGSKRIDSMWWQVASVRGCCRNDGCVVEMCVCLFHRTSPTRLQRVGFLFGSARQASSRVVVVTDKRVVGDCARHFSDFQKRPETNSG